MALYPLIANGVIADLAPNMFLVNPAFVWGTDVSAIEPQPQPGWTATQGASGWTYAAPPAPPTPALTAAQQAQAAYTAAIAGGLAITSTSAPTLNGTYAIDTGSTADISAEAQFIAQFNEFTNGTTTNLLWPLQSGSTVTFPTTTEFLAFAKVAAQMVSQAKQATLQGNPLPAMTATIP